MDGLVKELIAKAGIDASQAQAVVEVVTGFLKDKLPADVMNQVSGLVGGLGDLAGDAAGAAKDAASDAAGAAQDAAGDAKDAAGGIMGKLGGLFGGGDKG